MAERRDISTSSWKGAPEPRGVAEPEAKAARESDDLPFGVVGIGASAGGIDAFRSLLGALPADTGMAYVVVQHLSPDHPSFLAQTLARFTSMPVLEIQDGTRLVPGHVYVLPSNAEVLLSRGTLRLVPRPPSPGGRLPIDALFLSLARELRSRAIGVVLSGTGEDGTAGLKEIKAEGGLTFAQTSASAHFTGMPESASAAGVVDRVLPPDQIAAELTRLGRHPYVVDRPAAGEQTADDPDAIARILSLVHRHSGVDFSAYRPSTVSRRSARRMALHRIPTASEYADFAGKDPAEPRALSQDLLIHVTGFFRDPEVFEGLRRVVFPALTGNKREGPIRIWVPGCSTGEEVYSLAIGLLEYFGESSAQGGEFQIFGSDLSQRAIECARTGLYPGTALRDVGEDRRGPATLASGRPGAAPGGSRSSRQVRAAWGSGERAARRRPLPGPDRGLPRAAARPAADEPAQDGPGRSARGPPARALGGERARRRRSHRRRADRTGRPESHHRHRGDSASGRP